MINIFHQKIYAVLFASFAVVIFMVATADAQTGKTNAEQYIAQGEKFFQEENWGKAIKAYEQAAKLTPNDGHIFASLGSAYYNSRQFTKSIAAFQETLRLDPHFPDAKPFLTAAIAAEKAKKERRSAFWKGVAGAIAESVAEADTEKLDETKEENAPQSRQTPNNDIANTGTALANAPGGFAAGHRLDGRYKLRNAFQYFTFYADGTLKSSYAAAGDFRGGDYVAGGEGNGTYTLNGHLLTVNLNDRKSEVYEIEVYRCCETPNYGEQRPLVLKIHNAFFDNVDP